MWAGSVAPTTAPIPLSGAERAGEPLGQPVDERRQALVQRRPGVGRSWRSAAPGLLVRTRAKTPAPAASAAATSGSSASRAEQRVGGEGVGAEPGDRAPGRRRLADQGLAVGRRR